MGKRSSYLHVEDVFPSKMSKSVVIRLLEAWDADASAEAANSLLHGDRRDETEMNFHMRRTIVILSVVSAFTLFPNLSHPSLQGQHWPPSTSPPSPFRGRGAQRGPAATCSPRWPASS